MAYEELMGMAPLARRGLVDGMIAQNRAQTPASAQEQRKSPRYSIAELNSMDLPEIKARWSADPFDTRGAGTRVLDMIDLPRNVIANTLFKATGVVKDDPRNKAALGLQRVSVSDALEAMGVENRIVRGVAGFVGDVLLDPITYLGPPGFGIKAVSSGGRTVQAGLNARRAINAASLEARAGKAITDPALAKVLALDNVGTDAAKISESLYGAGKPAWKRLGEVFGVDRSTEGFLGYADPLVSRTGVEAEKQAAAMDFVRRYGQGTAPGIRIGKDAAGKWGVEFAKQGPGRIKAGSALAHIPFTEYSLSVPALTGNAMYGLAAQTLREVDEKSDPAMAATMSKIRDLDELSRTQMDLLNGLRNADPEQRAYTMVDLVKARERMQPVLQELDMELGAQQKAAEALNDPAKLLAIGRLRDASQALATKITADAAKWQIENGEAMARYRDQIKPLLETRTEELTRANLALENQKVADARSTKDEIVNASAKEAADIMRKGMDDAAKWMVDITPEELDARAFLADAIHGTANAAKQLADAAGAPLLATMRGEDVNLRRAAELALGYTPDMLGNGAFMSMARAMDNIMGPDSEAANILAKMDAGMGRAFGSRESTLKDLTREYARWDAARGQAVEQEAGKRIMELAGVAEKFGVPPEKLDELGAAYLLAAFTKADPNLANFSPRDPIHGLLASAKAGGLLDAKTNPELVATIQGMAARDVGLLADYANQEQRMGVLGKLMDKYMPNVLTPEAGAAARAQRRNFPIALGKGAEASNAPGDVLGEAFSKPRSTYVYDIGGKDYLAGSLEVMKGMSVEDIRKLSLDPVAEDALMDLKAVQETFDALPDDVKPKPRPASQFYINQLVEQGQMAMLTGGRELTKGFFETSPPLIMAARIGAHERARIRTYFDEMMKNLAVPYNEKIVGTTANAAGATFKTQGGAEGMVSKGADGSLRVTIGNQRFRTVSPEVIASGSDLLDAKNPKFANALLPERAADAVENFYRVAAKEPQALLAAVDSATKYWKSATLLHPSWAIGDLVGGFVLAAGMGITPAEMTKHGAAAFKMIARTDPEKLAALKIPLAGAEVSGAKIAQEIADGGVLHGARNAEAVAHILHDGVALTPAQYSLLRNPKEAAHEIASRGQMRARAMAYGSLTGQPNALQKAKGLVIDEVYLDRLWKPWVRMNGKVNDWMRSTAYLALRDRGYDPTSAARAVSEGMLDMGSLTDVESNVLRRLIPFYAWMKSSAVHGLRQTYLNPKYFSTYPHAARAFEEATAGDARVPEYARPKWMRDQMAIQVGADPSTRMAFMSGTLLPQEAATRWMSGMASPAIGMAGLQDLAGYVASGVSPLLRVPMEVGFGQEFYTGRTIRAQKGQGDFTPGEYLLSQIRPLREFGVGQVRQGAIQNAASRGPAQLAGRLLMGGRFQPFDEERLKFNNIKEFKDAEGQIRRRINVAERDGNKDASQQSRVALLKLYESMRVRGLGDEVPKWARSQLPQVTGAVSE